MTDTAFFYQIRSHCLNTNTDFTTPHLISHRMLRGRNITVLEKLLFLIWITQVKSVLTTILVLTVHLAQVTRVHNPQYLLQSPQQRSLTHRNLPTDERSKILSLNHFCRYNTFPEEA